MAGFNPGQAFLMAKTRPDLEDPSYTDARRKNDGTDYDFSDVLKNVPKGPQPGTDPLTGMPLDLVQGQSGPDVAMNFTGAKDFARGFGQRLGDFLQFVPGSEEDPRTLDGAPMPGGMDPNYEALPPGAKERFNNMIEGKESPIQVGW